MHRKFVKLDKISVYGKSRMDVPGKDFVVHESNHNCDLNSEYKLMEAALVFLHCLKSEMVKTLLVIWWHDVFYNL